MSSSSASVRGLWLKWKTLKLPWRKQWLCGMDLNGNTFWEFKNPLNPHRPRRIAKYSRRTHLGDVKLTPAWLQWLRHTRPIAPTVEEQELEVQRQQNMKQLASSADARWREQESFLDRPQDLEQTRPLLQPKDKGAYIQKENATNDGFKSMAATQEDTSGSSSEIRTSPSHERGTANKNSTPFSVQRGGPGQEWQPQSWSPESAQIRR